MTLNAKKQVLLMSIQIWPT